MFRHVSRSEKANPQPNASIVIAINTSESKLHEEQGFFEGARSAHKWPDHLVISSVPDRAKAARQSPFLH